jgi:hypothetical protein
LGEGLVEAVGLREAFLGQFSGLSAQTSVYVKFFYVIFILHYLHRMLCSQFLIWMMHYVKNIDMLYVEGFLG